MEQKIPFDIDLVYAWVDGNDPVWRAKHNAFTGVKTSVDANCSGRYADNDELKYSLRTVEKYVPWIRNIYIITDNQVPSWLDTSNPKIHIVDHKDIMPSEALPCFNSTVIEHFLHNVDGLAEHFLYANDDMFFNRLTEPTDFFNEDGWPIIRLKRCHLRDFGFFFRERILHKPLSTYKLITRNSIRLGKLYYSENFGDKTHHNIDAYCLSDYKTTASELASEIRSTIKNHLRTPCDIERIIYMIAALHRGHGHVEYVGRSTSFRIKLEKPGSYARLDKYNPLLFCLNDSQYATDDDRRQAKEFLQNRYPEKSSFEK